MIVQKNTPEKYIVAMSKCGKCGKCCQFDSGHLFEEDAKRISKHLRVSKEKFEKDYLDEAERFNTKSFKPKLIKENNKPYGRCIFLKNNECSIHSVKPMHCRIGNPCKEYGETSSIWFNLNYFVNEKDPESIRQWAMYLKTHPTIPGGTLQDLVPDKQLLKKMLNYEVLTEKDFEKYEQDIKKQTKMINSKSVKSVRQER